MLLGRVSPRRLPGAVWLCPPTRRRAVGPAPPAPHERLPPARSSRRGNSLRSCLAGACAPGFALRARATAALASFHHLVRRGDPPSASMEARRPGSLGADPSSSSAIRGGAEKREVGRRGRRGVTMPKRGSRRIGATNRGAACVAQRFPSPGDLCRPLRPPKRPARVFAPRPGAPRDPSHAPKHTPHGHLMSRRVSLSARVDR